MILKKPFEKFNNTISRNSAKVTFTLFFFRKSGSDRIIKLEIGFFNVTFTHFSLKQKFKIQFIKKKAQ